MMGRRTVIAIAGGMLAYPALGWVQPKTDKTFRIGSAYVAPQAATKPYGTAFLVGLRERGFEVGRNLVYDVRHCDGDQACLPAAVDELIALKPDLLAGIEQVGQVMRSKTSLIPIVLTVSSDPVAAGLVKTLSRPGGNVTGMAALTELMAAKQVEMLGELLPRLTGVAVLLDPGMPAMAAIEQHARAAAQVHRASVVTYVAKDRAELERAFAQMEMDRPAAALSASSGMFFGQRHFIAESALRRRVPCAGGAAAHAEAGYPFSYGADLHDMFRRAASHAARILQGAKPSDLPIEQPTKFEVVINLKTARALGITIPQSLLLRADGGSID